MSAKAKILLAVVLLFAVVLGMKLGSSAVKPATTAPAGSGSTVTAQPSTGATLPASETRGDANAAYEAALASGKPMYVLFHSTTCQSCIDISRVIDGLLPEYEGRLVFVNAITDDPGSRTLASRFEFQYIPTSFFIGADGRVTDTYVGPLDEAALRERLDKLVAP